MPDHFGLKILVKTYDLYKEFYLEIKKWSKPERYNLGQKCEKLILILYENLLAAAMEKQKENYLKQANLKIQVLKLFFRLAKEIGVLNERKYWFFEQKIIEIGKMLGGWLKSVNRPS